VVREEASDHSISQTAHRNGRPRAHQWVLNFERCTSPDIDELMGWTAGSDTLATKVWLTFATRAEAVAYAKA
jgi:hypothetical protein